MPELPEVETVRRSLLSAKGMRAVEVWTSGLSLRLNQAIDEPHIRANSVGARVEDIRRRGKYLLIDFHGKPQALYVHLGMSGRLRLMSTVSQVPKHVHVSWTLVGAHGEKMYLRYSDPRRFGMVGTVERAQEDQSSIFGSLGVDPLNESLDGEVLFTAMHQSRRNIKALLLDQRIIAGIGNIYASEALWKAQISPNAAGQEIDRRGAARLAKAIVYVLDYALTHGGTTLRDFVNAEGHAGSHSDYLCVYGREGKSCLRPRCRGIIVRSVIQGRASYYCPRCQGD